MPVRTSPVPAVARTGRPGHVDEQPPVRARRSRCDSPSAGRPRRVWLGQRPHVRGPVRIEVARLHAGEPRELADVRREHGLGLPIAERRRRRP